MRLILFIFSLTFFQTYGQETYFVKEGLTEGSIPFVKIYPNDAKPFLADLDGAFEIQASTTTFQRTIEKAKPLRKATSTD